jgi:hypothetical protein
MATATIDEFIAASAKTPPLVEIKEINQRHISESPPLASRDSSAVPSDDEDAKDCEDLERGDRGDFNLISQWAPDNLIAARRALNYRLPTERNAVPSSMSIDQPGPNVSASVENNVAQQTFPASRVQPDGDFLVCLPATRKESIEGALLQAGRRLSLNDHGPHSPSAAKKALYDTRPPPLQRAVVPRQQEDEDDSLAKSPLLAQFTIDASRADPANVLAAISTTSPPRTIVRPGDGKQTLPSLTTALSDAGSPFSVPSPILSRSASSQFGPPLSTISSISSALSPPNYTSSNPHFWKSSRERTNSTSTPSDATATTPHSAWTSQSPGTSMPTPLSTTSSHTNPDTFPPSLSSHSTASTSTSVHSGINGVPLSPNYQHAGIDPAIDPNNPANNITGIFRCSVPGCTAAPFQTQYLLNSHANVHSDTRPHFCPVANCPRGPGGQGFKRKNEMIR